MKNLFTLLLVLSVSLIARENPFEATNAYEEEAARIIEMNEVEEDYAVEYQQEQQYVNEMYEKMNKPKEEKPKVPALTEEKVQKMINKAQKETEKKAKTIAKEVIVEQPKQVEQVVYVKPRLDVVNEKQLLPFVKVEYDNDRIDIFSKYSVSKKITLPGEKKVVLDFNAKENFYTVRDELKSTNFPKIAVGNHKDENFFRIVIELASTPDDYEVTYDNEKVSVIKLYE
ncbi:AMIN domain-containing protein [Campylobacterota bacterium DY0563]